MSYSPKQETNLVEDQMGLYLSSIPQSSRQPQFNAKLGLRRFFSDRMLLVEAIRQGVPLSLFLAIKHAASFTDNEWCAFLGISLKSLQRFKNNKAHVFKPIHSEKILELAEVNALGLEVFDSIEQFHLWLGTPSFALGNMQPKDLLQDSYGKELVMNELNRIDNGVFA